MKQGDALSLPKGWEIKKLGEVLKVQNGFAFNSKLFTTETGTPLIRIRDIKNGIGTETNFNGPYYKKYEVKAGDFLIGMDGEFGCYEWKGDTALLNQRVCRLQEFSNKLHPRFLFYGINKYLKAIEDVTAYATVKHISSKQIEAIEIPLPPLPEQQRIVSILDEAFAAIAKAKANAEQNLKNAKELFESYLEDLFTNLFQKCEKKNVSELAKVIGGYSFKSTDFKKEGKYQVIRMGNVRPGIIRENESPVFIDELDDRAFSKALLLKNDVIITQTGTKKKRDYGFTVIIEKENYLLNQRIASIRFSDKYLSKFFLYFSWTNIFKDQYFANETGTVGQGNVGIGAITDAIVPFIPVKEQKMIIDKIDEIRTETQKLEAVYQKKIDDLEELKKSILQKAFAGELKTEKAVAV